MAKSDIRIEEAHAVIDRVSQELGLLVSDTSFGKKVQGPSNKHRMYVQKGAFLGRIDFTVALDQGDPAYIKLEAPNGAIRCRVSPSLEHLERCLRMLGDTGLDVQVSNKPRPFSATHRPKAIAIPVPIESLPEVPVDSDRARLEDRIEAIKAQARSARIRMVLENQAKYGLLSEDEAAALVDGRLGSDADVGDVIDASRNADLAEVSNALSEAGIEVSA